MYDNAELHKQIHLNVTHKHCILGSEIQRYTKHISIENHIYTTYHFVQDLALHVFSLVL